MGKDNINISKERYLELLKSESEINLMRDFGSVTVLDTFIYSDEPIKHREDMYQLKMKLQFDAFMMEGKAERFIHLIKDIFTLKK